jgi:hypothetical protein
MIDLLISVGIVFTEFFQNEIMNAVLIGMHSLAVIILLFLGLVKNHKFNITYRISFVFLAIGLFHNITLRLVLLEIVDPLSMVEIPNIMGYVLSQIGIDLFAYTYIIVMTTRYYKRRKNENNFTN